MPSLSSTDSSGAMFPISHLLTVSSPSLLASSPSTPTCPHICPDLIKKNKPEKGPLFHTAWALMVVCLLPSTVNFLVKILLTAASESHIAYCLILYNLFITGNMTPLATSTPKLDGSVSLDAPISCYSSHREDHALGILSWYSVSFPNPQTD